MEGDGRPGNREEVSIREQSQEVRLTSWPGLGLNRLHVGQASLSCICEQMVILGVGGLAAPGVGESLPVCAAGEKDACCDGFLIYYVGWPRWHLQSTELLEAHGYLEYIAPAPRH